MRKDIYKAERVAVVLQNDRVTVEVDGHVEFNVTLHPFHSRPVVVYDERVKKDPVLVTTPKNTAKGSEPIYDSNNSDPRV